MVFGHTLAFGFFQFSVNLPNTGRKDGKHKMLGGLGPTEIIIILFIILIVFGAGKLPDIASGLGKGLRDFKKAMRDLDEPDSESSPKEIPGETRSTDENGQG